jgi:hypothetical protein
VALEAMKNASSRPASLTSFFIINSAIGERQILPWQTNIVFIIGFFLSDLPDFALFCKAYRGDFFLLPI